MDGSKFKAVNNKDRNFTPFTPAKLQRLLSEIETKINGYLQQLEEGDKADAAENTALKVPASYSGNVEPEQLPAKIARLQLRQGRYRALLKTLQESGETQIS